MWGLVFTSILGSVLDHQAWWQAPLGHLTSFAFRVSHVISVVVVRAYNPRVQEAEVGGLNGQSQPGLHGEAMSQKTRQNSNDKRSKC